MAERELPSDDLTRILITEEEIAARVREIAAEITAEYAGKNPYFVGILKGAFIFLADLTRALEMRHVVDFMALSSYGLTTTSGEVRIIMDLREPIEDRHVVIVEDIVDTGNTLRYLVRTLKSRGPASLETCVLLRKERQESADLEINYLGFTLPDVWVVGYGLDFADRFRTLPYIAEMKQVG
jgi:hypoxanthine phosphoribosyltransferase